VIVSLMHVGKRAVKRRRRRSVFGFLLPWPGIGTFYRAANAALPLFNASVRFLLRIAPNIRP